MHIAIIELNIPEVMTELFTQEILSHFNYFTLAFLFVHFYHAVFKYLKSRIPVLK